jgi:YidC/Oxa1 family membrane protein insertase
MDRKTLLAVALCLIVLIGYPFVLKLFGLDRYLQKAPPQKPVAVDTSRTAVVPGRPGTPSPVGTPTMSATPLSIPTAELERTIHLETPLYRADFSNRGARLIAVELKRYAVAHSPTHKPGREIPSPDRVVLAGGPSLGIDLGSRSSLRSLADAVYAVEESTDAAGQTRALTFTLHDPSGLLVRQRYRVRADDYALDLAVEIQNVPLAWRLTDYSITTRSWPLVNEGNPQDEHRSLRASSLVGANMHREVAGGLKKGPKVFEGNAVSTAVQTRYFMGAVAVTQGAGKSVTARAEARTLKPQEMSRLPEGSPATQEVAVDELAMGLPAAGAPPHQFVVYFGPSEYFRLSRIGHQLERFVDLGWNWIRPFSKLLLQLLVWLHGVLKNYGVAIVLLATLVRVVLHPLNMMSIKSMRAMQRLQPEMERIKDKYKNDPAAMNTAVMALYRENKVNPAGGCLPTILQMPLFIALYSVLYNAIELRQAPFMAWIHDLSAPDLLFSVGPFPVRLLPILMTLSGLLSQRLTPVDPRQAPTMYMMNVMMLVFFYNLPSGLVLYWTVMNLLTSLQQWLALREDGTPGVVVYETSGNPPGGRGRSVAKKVAGK